MTAGPVMMRIDHDRLHFQHGPIDLIVHAEGPVEAVEAAYAQAWKRFSTILHELVSELPLLRLPVGEAPPEFQTEVATTMFWSVWPFRERYITPMAAVAGSVAEEILGAMVLTTPIKRGMVNNGGDIAIYLADEEKITVGVVERPDFPQLAGTITIDWTDPSRGIATSGWRGRSMSLGIADAATVIARKASMADAAATIIGNAVNIDHPAILRAPATSVADDTDLGDIPVTIDVGDLPPEIVSQALDNGEGEARRLQEHGLIDGAVLLLQGEHRVIGEHASRALIEVRKWY
jgi:ApbE superfamily uncharacterized protein (UPF0280 family)